MPWPTVTFTVALVVIDWPTVVASRRVTDSPWSCNSKAVVNPATPAPTTTTSTAFVGMRSVLEMGSAGIVVCQGDAWRSSVMAVRSV